ncbi:hypothetical protein [Billgrantia endophytica]|uniref:hypothetical protein n=1 Tax=Billgrantia endophytica TaxID=2033802 RepID=UPI0010565CB6|nr:hypothetical protein [Halomonas endophytica]
MDKKNVVNKTWRGTKFIGHSFNPVNWVTPFFRYNPTGISGITKNILNGINVKKIFSKKGNKDLYEALMSAKSKSTFKRSMEKEGLTEADLKVGHSRYQKMMLAMIIIPLWPIYHLFNLMNTLFNQGFSLLPFLSSILIPLAGFMFCIFLYFYFAWLALRIRNNMLFSPREFFIICKQDITNLSPFEEYEDTLVNKEKEGKDKKKNKL